MKYTPDLLFSIEPGLRTVINTASNVVSATGNIDLAYVTAKDASNGLVGYGAQNPELRNSEAYCALINLVCETVGF